MKKKVLALFLSIAVMRILSGCGESADVDKLTIWTNMEVESETIQKYADQWGEITGYTVEVVHQSPSVQQFAQAVNSASGPDAVVGIPNDQLADYVNAGLAAEVPVDLYKDADFSDASIQACYPSLHGK